MEGAINNRKVKVDRSNIKIAFHKFELGAVFVFCGIGYFERKSLFVNNCNPSAVVVTMTPYMFNLIPRGIYSPRNVLSTDDLSHISVRAATS